MTEGRTLSGVFRLTLILSTTLTFVHVCVSEKLINLMAYQNARILDGNLMDQRNQRVGRQSRFNVVAGRAKDLILSKTEESAIRRAAKRVSTFGGRINWVVKDMDMLTGQCHNALAPIPLLTLSTGVESDEFQGQMVNFKYLSIKFDCYMENGVTTGQDISSGCLIIVQTKKQTLSLDDFYGTATADDTMPFKPKTNNTSSEIEVLSNNLWVVQKKGANGVVGKIFIDSRKLFPAKVVEDAFITGQVWAIVLADMTSASTANIQYEISTRAVFAGAGS